MAGRTRSTVPTLKGRGDDNRHGLGGAKGGRADLVLGLLRFAAYLWTAEADGWQRFCEELQIDPEVLLTTLPLSPGLKEHEELARRVAFTPEEAQEWCRRHIEAEGPLKTADSVAAELRAVLDQVAAAWG